MVEVKGATWSRRKFIKRTIFAGCFGAGAYLFESKRITDNKVLSILSFPDPLLRQVALPVTEFGDSLVELTGNIIATLKYQAFKGLCTGGSLSKGLAAPQVGVSRRIIACSLYGTVQILVNPKIVTQTGSYPSKEGCLSLPGRARRVVKRSQKVHVRYCDIQGNEKEVELKARFAAALEHEIDHLNGVLYIDKLQAS